MRVEKKVLYMDEMSVKLKAALMVVVKGDLMDIQTADKSVLTKVGDKVE